MALYAKSARGGQALSLVEHSRHVVTAFRAMFGTQESATRLARCWQRFFRIGNLAQFFTCGVAAATLHDWGKANDGFQSAVTQSGRQLIWHEHLSALLMNTEAARNWFRGRCDVDWDVVVSSVLTHHLRAGHDTVAQQLSDGTHVIVSVDDSDFAEFLELVRQHTRASRWSSRISRGCGGSTANRLHSTRPAKVCKTACRISRDRCGNRSRAGDCFGP